MAARGSLTDALLGRRKATASDAQPQRPFLLAICLVAFVASGVSQPLTMSAVKLAGLGDTTCQLYMLPYYLGMACTGLLGLFMPRVRWGNLPLHRCVLIALVDIVSQVLNYSGNMRAGSAIFAVIYASVTVWSAVFSRIFLQRVLSLEQWAAVIVVFLGLALTGIGARSHGAHVLEGACMVFVGSALHAVAYVLSELVSVKGDRVPPHINCCVQALTASVLVGTWQVSYTAGNWDKIALPMEAAGTSGGTVAALALSLAIGNFVHAATFFYLLAWIGAVSAGVMKGLQAGLVFVLAHIFYCKHDPSQCFCPAKVASLVMVVTGVLVYTYATALSGAGKQH